MPTDHVDILLKELSVILRLSVPCILICLAVTTFLALGSSLSLAVGTRKVFIFGTVPVLLGGTLGIFPMYFAFVCLSIALCVAFISFPRRASYRDRVRTLEAEMYMEKLRRDG